MGGSVKLGVCPSWWMDSSDGGMFSYENLKCYFRAASAAEYQGIEVGFHNPRGLEGVGPLLRDNGLELASAVYPGSLSTAPYAREEKAVARHAEAVGRLGGGILVYGEAGGGPFPHGGKGARDEQRAYADKITTMAGFLRESFGICLVYRHHGRADGMPGDFLLEIGDDVGVSLDTRVLRDMGGDFIRALGSRIRLVYVARANAQGAPAARTKKTRGNAGPVGVFLADTEYKGWIMAEHSRDPGQPFRLGRDEFADGVACRKIP